MEPSGDMAAIITAVVAAVGSITVGWFQFRRRNDVKSLSEKTNDVAENTKALGNGFVSTMKSVLERHGKALERIEASQGETRADIRQIRTEIQTDRDANRREHEEFRNSQRKLEAHLSALEQRYAQ